MTVAAFWALAAVAVAAGFGVFSLNSMARVTFSLLASFLAVAAIVVLLGLGYLGVVTALMMVIEMVIMAVFMLMYMMNPAGLMPMAMYHNKRVSLVLSIGTFAALAAGILLVPWPGPAGRPGADRTFQLGESLMGPQMLTMMTLGLALFGTIVATVVLATNRGRYDRYGDRLASKRPADPIPGGVGR